MKFGIISEGVTDFKVLNNLLVGFFSDKNLPVNPLFPEDKSKPAGWGNVLNYIGSTAFRESFDALDYMIIQIDTGEVAEWGLEISQIQNADGIPGLIEDIKNGLIKKIGKEFYDEHKRKIIFAISVHSIECWLLPFHYEQQGKYSKITSCFNAMEEIANKKGFSLNQKNYQEGKHYDLLSNPMKKNSELLQLGPRNPSLKIFLDLLNSIGFLPTP